MDYVKYGFKNYFNFEGRATRKQFWIFIAFIIGGYLIAYILDLLLGTSYFIGDHGLFNFLFDLAILFPYVTICVRRLHDIGRTGTWIFINVIPIVGAIVLLIFFCKPSDPEINEYGSPLNFVQVDNNSAE
jgi:Predicted membrane protein